MGKTITNKDLYQLGYQRLEHKKQRMRNLLKIALPDEALYREVMLSLGYKNNQIPFLELAIIFPYAEIKKINERKIIEKALLYRAGFKEDRTDIPEHFDFSLRMPQSVWTYKGTRPANYPERRIKQISTLLSETLEKSIFFYFQEKIIDASTKEVNERTVKSIVKRIISFDGPGDARKLDMFFNIILPFFMVVFENERNQRLLTFLENIIKLYPITTENKKIADKIVKKYTDEDLSLFLFIEFWGVLELKDLNIIT